ncbi:MAG TPA: hypothetical protein VFU89_05895, partial [Rhabdochlamydiaceae bacterium]|nr:hypothetical protein [Rhabdochlamydiaceae bacterium]
KAESYSLKYLQTKEKRQVDFALVRDKKVEQMIEVKYADASIDPSLWHFYEKYRLPAVQIVKELKTEKVEKGIEILRAEKFLKNLEL